MTLYLVHEAAWDTSLEGALLGHVTLGVREYDAKRNATSGFERLDRIRAPLFMPSYANRTRHSCVESIDAMREVLFERLEAYHERFASEDERFVIDRYFEEHTGPLLDERAARGRDGSFVWRARIPYPSIRALGLTREELFEPLEGRFPTRRFNPNAALATYLGGAYPIVEVRDGYALPSRHRNDVLRTLDIIAEDLETHMPSEEIEAEPSDVRSFVLERVEKRDRERYMHASHEVLEEKRRELVEQGDTRRIVIAQLATRDRTWIGSLLASDAFSIATRIDPLEYAHIESFDNLPALLTRHREEASDTPIIAGHTIDSDLEHWRSRSIEAFNARMKTPGMINGYKKRFSLEGRILIDTELHAKHLAPSLRSYDLDSVSEHLLGTRTKTLSAPSRRTYLEDALRGDEGAMAHLYSYALADVTGAYALGEAMRDDIIDRIQLHDTSAEKLSGLHERAMSEGFTERHRQRYAKRPAPNPRFGTRRFTEQHVSWPDFSLSDRYKTLIERSGAEGLGEMSIMRLHPYQHALEPLLSELESGTRAYGKARSGKRFLFSDLEKMCAHAVYLLTGSDEEPARRAFERVYTVSPEKSMHLGSRVGRVERKLAGMFEHAQVLATSGDLIAIARHDELEKGLETNELATRIARGPGFVSSGHALVSDRGWHTVAAADLSSGRGDLAPIEREAITTFEDTLVSSGPREALDSLIEVSARAPASIEREDVAQRFSYEYQPNARSARIEAHREKRSRPGMRVSYTEIEGLHETQRLVESLRGAFEGLHGQHGRALIEQLLRGDALARAVVESNVKRF